ncbi:hypothetical protein CEXT_491621 [Caerostris extrusa]|uniref:Uncharacterized protein n=1 Tax=Caerostris extrusa TaxID=172846 RepID=A0AAV4U2W9_CAEEX|nr:hypothetical protein CEXT_491621 [Caerostris extrusa]
MGGREEGLCQLPQKRACHARNHCNETMRMMKEELAEGFSIISRSIISAFYHHIISNSGAYWLLPAVDCGDEIWLNAAARSLEMTKTFESHVDFVIKHFYHYNPFHKKKALCSHTHALKVAILNDGLKWVLSLNSFFVFSGLGSVSIRDPDRGSEIGYHGSEWGSLLGNLMVKKRNGYLSASPDRSSCTDEVLPSDEWVGFSLVLVVVYEGVLGFELK